MLNRLHKVVDVEHDLSSRGALGSGANWLPKLNRFATMYRISWYVVLFIADKRAGAQYACTFGK